MKSKATIELIKSRRSIRKFKPEQIPYPDLQTIVEAALYAPNGMNQQKWHFSVVQERSMIDRMINTMKENMISSDNAVFAKNAKNPEYNIYYGAPTVILVTADEKSRFAPFDCAAAAENICLAAAALNIGSCIVVTSAFLFTSPRNNELKEELGVPPGYVHICSVALGYRAADNPEAPHRNKEVINYIR